MNTADLLIANLDRLLSSPPSAETIRKLIFDLAIRGRLSTQSDNDEPAFVLIEKVIRTAQAEDRKFSAEPPVTERPFELPRGWEWVRLGNTGRIFNGTSASAGEKIRLSKTTDGLPFIATKDVGYGRDPLSYENGLKVPHGDKDYKVARSGAVLICAEGGSAGKKVGQTNRPICFGNKLYANETWAGIEPGYILSLYQSNFFYGEFKAKMAGIIGGIARSDFRSLRIPLPPLAEQKRIVAKVDELMALCDWLEAQLKERDVKQAALAKAALAKFTEDPTPENLQLLFHPSFSIEPDDLRKTIMMLGATGMLLRANDLSRTKENDPYPSHRESLTLESITTRMDSGWSPECLDRPANETEWGVLKTTAVQSLSYLESQNKALPKSLEPRPEDEVQDGDLLFTRAGPNNRVGILCVAKPTRSKLMLSDKIIRLRLSSKALPEFVAIQLSAEPVAAEIHKLKSGMAETQVNISQSKLKKVMVSLPSIDEQRAIVLRIKALTELIEELSGQLEASRTTGEKLLEAMVSELTSA